MFPSNYSISEQTGYYKNPTTKNNFKKKAGPKHVVREMYVRGNVRSEKCLSGEMSSRVSVQSENCPFGEMSVRGNVRWGSVRRESVSRGIVLGEVSVGELSSRGTVRIPFELQTAEDLAIIFEEGNFLMKDEERNAWSRNSKYI